MNCPRCGATIPQDANYCSSCGTALKKESTSEVTHNAFAYSIRADLRGFILLGLNCLVLGATLWLLMMITHTHDIGVMAYRIGHTPLLVSLAIPLILLNSILYVVVVRD